eukprot:1042727-Lingulodinium_polyedra.AAC.1
MAWTEDAVKKLGRPLPVSCSWRPDFEITVEQEGLVWGVARVQQPDGSIHWDERALKEVFGDAWNPESASRSIAAFRRGGRR